jgi:hypothetical protein
VQLNTQFQFLEMEAHPLVIRLYENVPMFESSFEKPYQELPHVVFGDLGLQLHDKIINGDVDCDLVVKSFDFFTQLSLENLSHIDELLVVSIYEGFYYSKVCNDFARSILSGRAKELYEYWMINGSIQSFY